MGEVRGISTDRGGVNLQTAALLAGWPTPTTIDNNQVAGTGAAANAPKRGTTLGGAARLAAWPTPTATDGKGGYQGGRLRNGILSTDRLDVAAQLAEPVRLTVSGETLTGCTAGMESGVQLNPALSRWLMGLPHAWDESSPGWQEWQAATESAASKATATP